MLVPLSRLLARVRQVPSRAAELAELTRRLRAERALPPDPEERAIALRLRALKAEIARAIGEVSCCSGCAAGLPAPGGIYAGGHCCSGHTAVIFSDDDVAALALAGTRPRDLAAPRAEHAGCAFRGPTGCTLAPGDRATLCLRFVCDDLRRELHDRGRLDDVERRIAELEHAFAELSRLRAERIEREWLAALADELAAGVSDPARTRAAGYRSPA